MNEAVRVPSSDVSIGLTSSEFTATVDDFVGRRRHTPVEAPAESPATSRLSPTSTATTPSPHRYLTHNSIQRSLAVSPIRAYSTTSSSYGEDKSKIIGSQMVTNIHEQAIVNFLNMDALSPTMDELRADLTPIIRFSQLHAKQFSMWIRALTEWDVFLVSLFHSGPPALKVSDGETLISVLPSAFTINALRAGSFTFTENHEVHELLQIENVAEKAISLSVCLPIVHAVHDAFSVSRRLHLLLAEIQTSDSLFYIFDNLRMDSSSQKKTSIWKLLALCSDRKRLKILIKKQLVGMGGQLPRVKLFHPFLETVQKSDFETTFHQVRLYISIASGALSESLATLAEVKTQINLASRAFDSGSILHHLKSLYNHTYEVEESLKKQCFTILADRLGISEASTQYAGPPLTMGMMIQAVYFIIKSVEEVSDG